MKPEDVDRMVEAVEAGETFDIYKDGERVAVAMPCDERDAMDDLIYELGKDK